MNPLQRIVLVLYSALVAYCCLWVPWRVQANSVYAAVGYGWLWTGPYVASPGIYRVPAKDPSAPVIEVVVGPPPQGVPKADIPLILGRIALFTSITFAALLAVKTPKTLAKL